MSDVRCTTSLQVLFGLPLGLATSSTSNSKHFFTQLSSSFCNTCPYQCNLFCCSTEIMSSNLSNLSTLYLVLYLLPQYHTSIWPFSSLPAEVPPHFLFLHARSHFHETYCFTHNCCTITLSHTWDNRIMKVVIFNITERHTDRRQSRVRCCLQCLWWDSLVHWSTWTSPASPDDVSSEIMRGRELCSSSDYLHPLLSHTTHTSNTVNDLLTSPRGVATRWTGVDTYHPTFSRGCFWDWVVVERTDNVNGRSLIFPYGQNIVEIYVSLAFRRCTQVRGRCWGF